MVIPQLILIVDLVVLVTCDCSYTSWWYSFDSKGQSKCKESNYYIKGLERNDVNRRDDPLSHLEAVECCSATSPWSNMEVLVYYADWTYKLDKDKSWAYCPAGYFLQGLQRSDTGWPRYKGYLFNIENARCAKPATHPERYGNCYVEDITHSFDRKGRVSCKNGYYINGLYRGNGDDLYYLDLLSCCSMAKTAQEINSVDELKTQIMEKSIWNMASLAHFLGYGHCLGIGALNVGEDFHRSKDLWQASTRIFYPDNIFLPSISFCKNDHKCQHRLNINFGDWSVAVKAINYGEFVHDSLEPETIHTAVIHNRDSSELTKQLEISETVQETITHTTVSSWRNSHDLSISLDFKKSDKLGMSFSYTTSFEHSSSTTNQQEKMNSTTLTITTSKNLKPYSAAKYRVIMSKSRTTIPYTAVIIAKFSTEFKGFMRWGGGYGSPTTNFHYIYKGDGNRPTFNYRFGDKSVPFYAALRKESETEARPWFWNDVLKNHPSARHVINRLTDETQYEFTLSGTLEQVAGKHIDVVWEAVNITKREATVEKSNNVVNGKYIVTAGPNDRPAKVLHPKVSLVTAEPFEFETIPVNKNMN